MTFVWLVSVLWMAPDEFLGPWMNKSRAGDWEWNRDTWDLLEFNEALFIATPVEHFGD